jgi:preprotein translocase subunit SecG
MSTLITILHAIVSLFLILTILLQSGKGGGMGGAFGGSNAGTVFGGGGASTFLRKMTAVAAIIFMSTSIVLAFIASHDSSDALEKFGRSQADLAKKKEEAKEKALLEGQGSGSAGSAAPVDTMGLPTPPATTDTPPASSGSAAVTPPSTDTPSGSGTAAGNASTVDPTRTGSAGIGLPNTPGVQQKPAPKKVAPKTDTSTTPSTAPAPTATDTTKSPEPASTTPPPADSTPNSPK